MDRNMMHGPNMLHDGDPNENNDTIETTTNKKALAN